jgi:deoxyadenosine/deoxycytidine kinase
MRIEICGGIATGKTTLARQMSPSPVMEQFRENPFWARFYAEPSRWFEEKNLTFLIQHIGAMKAAEVSAVTICDFAVVQDLAYAALSGRPDHVEIMERVFRHLYAQQSPPALIVHLRCNIEVQAQRIASRARPEEATIRLDYVEALNRSIELVIASVRADTPVLDIDSAQEDFARDAEVADRVQRRIMQAAMS